MAKKSLTLNGFEGGLNLDADASDIISEGGPDDEVVVSDNLFLDYKGKIIAEHPEIVSQSGVLTLSAGTFNDSWSADTSSFPHFGVAQTGDGKGLLVETRTAGATTTITIIQGGSGFTVGDTIRFTDPAGSGNTQDLTVASVNTAKLTIPSTNVATDTRALVYNNKFYQNEAVYKMGEAVSYNKDNAYIIKSPQEGKLNDPIPEARYNGVDITATNDRSSTLTMFLGSTAADNSDGNGMIMDLTELGGKGGYKKGPRDYVLYTIDFTNDGQAGAGWNRWGENFPEEPSGSAMDDTQAGYNIVGYAQGVSNNADSSYANYANQIKVYGSTETAAVTINTSAGFTNATAINFDRGSEITGFNSAVDITNVDSINFWRASTIYSPDDDATVSRAGAIKDTSSHVVFRVGKVKMRSGISSDGAYGQYLRTIQDRDIAIETQLTYTTTDEFDGIYITAWGNENPDTMGDTGTDSIKYNHTSMHENNIVWKIPTSRLLEEGADEEFKRIEIGYNSYMHKGSNFRPDQVSYVTLGYGFVANLGASTNTSDTTPVIRVKEFTFLEPGTFGWAGKKWKFYQTFIQNGIESLYKVYPGYFLGVTAALRLKTFKPGTIPSGVRATKGNIYCQELDDSEIPVGDLFLMCTWDSDKGVKSVADDFYTPWNGTNQAFTYDLLPLKSTFTFESSIPSDTATLNALFGAATTVGRQVYIANVQKEVAQKAILIDGGFTYTSDMDPTEYITTHRTNKTFLRAKGSWSVAYAILVFSGTPTTNTTITLISSDQTSIEYTAKTSTNEANNRFINDSIANTTEALQDCIEHSSGHDGKLVVYRTTTSATNDTLIICQATAGEAGNTEIVSDLDNCKIEPFREGESGFVAGQKILVSGAGHDVDGYYTIASIGDDSKQKGCLMTVSETLGGSGTTQTHGDGAGEEIVYITAFEDTADGSLIMKSLIGKAAGFSDTQFIDLEFGGESIKVLESSGDRLLVFSETRLSIINVAQDVEFMEATFDYYGVMLPRQVCKVGEGVAWVNESGVFFFDSQQVTTLSDAKMLSLEIDGDNCAIGYDAGRNLLWVWVSVNNIWFYSFKSASWSGHIDHSNATTSGIQYSGAGVISSVSNSIPNTNVIGGPDGLSYYEMNFGSSGTGDSCLHYIGTHRAVTKHDRIQCKLQTGKITCGEIGRRKKFYKLYITAQNAENVRVKVKCDDTPSTFTTVKTDLSNGENEISLTSSGELASAAKGKYIQIEFTTQADDQPIRSDMVISDITLIYREKGLK